jgi:hypothetical protein
MHESRVLGLLTTVVTSLGADGGPDVRRWDKQGYIRGQHGQLHVEFKADLPDINSIQAVMDHVVLSMRCCLRFSPYHCNRQVCSYDNNALSWL